MEPTKRTADLAFYRRHRLAHTGLLPDFGEIIRSRRADLGLTQAAVAEIAGCVPSTISYIETQPRTYLPLRRIFWGLGRALDLTAEEMLEAAGYLEAEAAELRRAS